MKLVFLLIFQIAPMNSKRSALGAVAFGSRLYVCGGYDGQTSLESVEEYDPKVRRWAGLSAFIVPFPHRFLDSVFLYQFLFLSFPFIAFNFFYIRMTEGDVSVNVLDFVVHSTHALRI